MKKRGRNIEITGKILERLRNGDPDAFERVFISFYPKILSFNSALFGSPVLGREVTNQVFVNLWNNRDKIMPCENFGEQIHNIARRTVISFLLYSRIGESEKIVEKNARDFDNSSFTDDTETLTDIVLNRMSYPTAKAVWMSRDKGLSIEDIALEFNLPPAEISKILQKAAEEVNDVLIKFIITFVSD